MSIAGSGERISSEPRPVDVTEARKAIARELAFAVLLAPLKNCS